MKVGPLSTFSVPCCGRGDDPERARPEAGSERCRRQRDRRRTTRADGAGGDGVRRVARDGPRHRGTGPEVRARVHLVDLAHDVVRVGVRPHPVVPGRHVGHIHPLEGQRAGVQVAPSRRHALEQARLGGFVLAAEVVGGIEVVDGGARPVGLPPLAVDQAEADLHGGGHLGGLGLVPQRIARRVLQVPVVVTVFGLEDHVRVPARVVEERPVASVDPLHNRGVLSVHAVGAAHLEGSLPLVVHVAVEPQQQVVAVGLRKGLKLQLLRRIGNEIRQPLRHLGNGGRGRQGAGERGGCRRHCQHQSS